MVAFAVAKRYVENTMCCAIKYLNLFNLKHIADLLLTALGGNIYNTVRG